MREGKSKNRNIGEVNAIDITPTILSKLDIPIPSDLKGKVIN